MKATPAVLAFKLQRCGFSGWKGPRKELPCVTLYTYLRKAQNSERMLNNLMNLTPSTIHVDGLHPVAGLLTMAVEEIQAGVCIEEVLEELLGIGENGERVDNPIRILHADEAGNILSRAFSTTLEALTWEEWQSSSYEALTPLYELEVGCAEELVPNWYAMRPAALYPAEYFTTYTATSELEEVALWPIAEGKLLGEFADCIKGLKNLNGVNGVKELKELNKGITNSVTSPSIADASTDGNSNTQKA